MKFIFLFKTGFCLSPTALIGLGFLVEVFPITFIQAHHRRLDSSGRGIGRNREHYLTTRAAFEPAIPAGSRPQTLTFKMIYCLLTYCAMIPQLFFLTVNV